MIETQDMCFIPLENQDGTLASIALNHPTYLEVVNHNIGVIKPYIAYDYELEVTKYLESINPIDYNTCGSWDDVYQLVRSFASLYSDQRLTHLTPVRLCVMDGTVGFEFKITNKNHKDLWIPKSLFVTGTLVKPEDAIKDGEVNITGWHCFIMGVVPAA